MAVVGDIAELVHEQTYLGQVCNNVFHYLCTATSNLTVLATWYETNVVPQFKLNQNDLVTHTNLRLRNLFQDGEVYEEPLVGTGGVASGIVELPSFMAYGLRLDHSSGSVRPGFKRIVGCEETGIADGLVASTRVITLGSLSTYLVEPAATPLADWSPVIVGRVCETPNPVVGAKPSCLKYRLPQTQAESVFGIVTSVEVFSQPTSQNSRKWYT